MDQNQNQGQQNQGQQNQRPRDATRDYEETEGHQGGISNRGLDREIEEQSEVPPRGRSRDEENSNG